MRGSILLPLLLANAVGCREEPGTYVLVDHFQARATALECASVELGRDYAVQEIRAASDSTWTLLDESQRLIAGFDDDLRLLWSLDYPRAGPGAVDDPVSAVALGDSAVAIASRGNLRLVELSRSGREIRSYPLPFVPSSLAASPDGSVLVSAMPLGSAQPDLVHRWSGDSLAAVPIRRRPYADMLVGGLGNMTLLETLADGSALVVHQFFEPRGFVVAPDGRVEALAVPTPDGTRGQIDFVPTAPITEPEMLKMLVPAIALAVDRDMDQLFLMTRSGRMIGDRAQRAVLRLDRRLGFIDGFTAEFPATGMVYLPRKHTLLLVDDEDRFHACTLPSHDAPAARSQRPVGLARPQPGS